MDRVEATRAFLQVIEHETFSAAARALGVRQATVSRWIAALEEELGVQLFQRTTRSCALTSAGKHFEQRARGMIELWDAALATAREQQSRVTGTLRVSAPVVFGARIISPHLDEFISAHPSLDLDLRLSDTYVRLVDEGFDLAIRVGAPLDSSLLARTIATTPRKLVAAPRYLDAHGAPTSPAELSSHHCLTHTGVDNHVIWRFGEEKITVRGRFRTNHSETLLEVAKAAGGLALLASWLVDPAIERGELIELFEDQRAPRAPIQALYAPTRHRSPAIQAFIDFVHARVHDQRT